MRMNDDGKTFLFNQLATLLFARRLPSEREKIALDDERLELE